MLRFIERRGKVRIWNADFSKATNEMLARLLRQQRCGITEYIGNGHWVILRIDKEQVTA